MGEVVPIGDGVRDDERGRQGLVERGEPVGVRQPCRVPDRFEQERPLDGRGDVEQAVGDPGEPAAPAGDHVPNALGHRRQGSGARSCPSGPACSAPGLAQVAG